ncbi:NAD(P)-dependent oxidoreductase [Sphingobium sp. Sx8-8]|uniref:NAD-dependent epimerase/dehydratase family protein n=1 Tax=Sphingobium sp. Sx8-8 TaxID=2933617 RepID=UPI001F5A8D33|nr:NAD(P)-dependent oxidoreductase [Sphingobium sp. Sx8-8]
MLEGKKILITGHTGRIGQAVATRFAPVCEMWGLARYTREGSLEEAKSLGVIPVKGDFGRGSLDQVPTDFDYVLHIAADITPKSAEAGMIDNSDGPARLMKHCRNAKAFLHVSTTGVYRQNADPRHVYAEDDDLGGYFGGQYVPTKLAGEGAVRAACFILDLPTVICRQNVQYGGPHVNGGLIDRFLDELVTSGNVLAPTEEVNYCGAIHEDDICDIIEPSLGMASVPASIVNWCGDEAVEWHELFEYAGELIGKKPNFIRNPDFTFPNCVPDPAKRQSIGGPAKVSWQQGVRRSLEIRHPHLKLNVEA